MQRARILANALAAAGLIMACGLGSAPSVSSGDVATVVASTLQALTPAAPAATETLPTQAAQGIPVTYKKVSFTVPTGLAADAAPQTVPAATDANGGPWGAGPEHIEFRLDGYNVPAGAFEVYRIEVYPADQYASASAGANISLQRLRGALSDTSATLTNKTLPQVPDFNAASMMATKIQRLSFQNGQGVRTVTQYGQAVGPVANSGTFYHYQGLTNDGKYYIIAVLPVQASFLQNGNYPNAPLPPGGVPFPDLNQNPDAKAFDDYYRAVTDKLNATPDANFMPSLTTLDTLVRSFSVGP